MSFNTVPIPPLLDGDASFSNIISTALSKIYDALASSSTLVTGTGLASDNDILITTNSSASLAGSITLKPGTGSTNGSLVFHVQGTNKFIWPTGVPPSTDYVLGVSGITTDGTINTYQLTWVFGAICFHQDTLVFLEDGSKVKMSSLAYGTKVLCYTEDHSLIYSPVVDFTGVFPELSSRGIKIFYDEGYLVLSPNHLILVNNLFIKAEDVKDQDIIRVVKNGIITDTKVLAIKQVIETGWYTPLTETGTIVANGVFSSCHTTGPHHIVRMMYKPLYWLRTLLPFSKNDKVKGCHWYSIGFRRSSFGSLVHKILYYFFN